MILKEMFNVGKLSAELKKLQGDYAIKIKENEILIRKIKDIEGLKKDAVELTEYNHDLKEKHEIEMAELKKQHTKQLEEIKASYQKDESTFDSKVASETIRILASQGVNCEIEPFVDMRNIEDGGCDSRFTIKTFNNK
jgi:23S rRNA pseudoU1915 N3-methylase RlmH